MVMTLGVSLLNASLLPLLNHPLSLGLILLIQSISIAMISGWMNITFWYSYIMLLIMIGGMLVLFMYMTNVASNEKFKFSLPILIALTYGFIAISVLTLLSDQTILNTKFLINEIMTTPNPLSSLNKFLNFPAISLSTALIIYLLITMIVIIKIINIKHGPLRHHN
uniref:NADH-ubiquinone oxidoreductase chain 6 n=1 Tax=Prosopocoilus laterotarsus maedaorum TaxID=618908 RepID=A0A7H1DJK4_9SCAR|nr:NADH dehydrogenase subunit 6 [Prosopocoilus laterotarsus]QNS37146.1 NADH dehydrogenase subunit 6 [Prosopocoilus laterotarsus maedaorum]UTM10037.1 NADH dehydrogenase subunit 6 [Prosopocoilus laterotarsus]